MIRDRKTRHEVPVFYLLVSIPDLQGTGFTRKKVQTFLDNNTVLPGLGVSINASAQGDRAIIKVTMPRARIVQSALGGAVRRVYREDELDAVRALVNDPVWSPEEDAA